MFGAEYSGVFGEMLVRVNKKICSFCTKNMILLSLRRLNKLHFLQLGLFFSENCEQRLFCPIAKNVKHLKVC